MPVKHSHNNSGTRVFAALMPVMAAVLVGFIIIGVALPVLPLHVKNDLGFGTFIVGLVAGAQFAASLISRVWSGSYSDRRGAKKGVVAGLIAAAVSGLLYRCRSGSSACRYCLWVFCLPGAQYWAGRKASSLPVPWHGVWPSWIRSMQVRLSPGGYRDVCRYGSRRTGGDAVI